MQQVTPMPTILNEDSDNDEGFIVNTIQIKHKEKQAIIINNKRPTDFQPRYILNHSVIRKQLPQLVGCYPHFKNQQIIQPQPQKKLIKSTIMHPDHKYINNKNYRLLYQRSNKKLNSYMQIVDSSMNLSSIQSYSGDNYAMIKNWQQFNEENGEQLSFQSRFQCGNLQLVYKSLIDNHHYVLFIQNDTNSKGYNKWFYFAIKNKHKNINYTFTIVNFRKNFNFFKQGMKINKFSLKDYETTSNGWSKCGKNINFYKSNLTLNLQQQLNEYYSLTFQLSFQHQNDLTFLSLLPPYSYSKLISFLQQIKQSNKVSHHHHVKLELTTIAYSLSNTQVPYVIISNQLQPSNKNIVIIARQHPGQIWSSYLVQSVIQELVRESNLQKDWLLKNYTFRIFPMVNVDGVIYGNFRCDLSGMDLNRCWRSPNKLLHPQLVQIKQQITRLSLQEEVVCFLDFHGHSKDYNIFAYCSQTDNRGRILPYLISRNTSLFDFSACTYGLSKYKLGTARAVIYQITKATDAITIQSSFFASKNPLKLITPSSFDILANSILKAFKFLYSKSIEFRQAQIGLPKAMAAVAQLKLKNNIKQQQNSGSQSQPQLDQISLKQKIGKVIPKCPIIQQSLIQNKIQSQEIDGDGQVKKLKKIKKKNKIQNKIQPKQPQIKLQQITKQQKIPKISIRGKGTQSKNMILLQKVLNKMSRNGQGQGSNKRSMMQSSRIPQHSKRYQSLQLKQQHRNFHLEQTMKDKISTRLEFHCKYQKLEEEQFPMLCVLSDRKKQGFLQRLKRIHPTPLPKEKPIIRYQPTLIVNKKLDTMQKLRQRQKHSNDLVSSIWKQTKDQSNPNTMRSIFYGGL